MAFPEDQVFIQELIKKGLLTKSQIIQSQNLLREQLNRAGITKTLLTHFKIDEGKIAQSIAEIFKIPYMEHVNGLARTEVEELDAINIPEEFRFIPVLADVNEITIAIKDPPYQKLIDFVQKATNKHIIPIVLKDSDFDYITDENISDKKQTKPIQIDFSKLDVEKQGLQWAKNAEVSGTLPSANSVLERLLETAIETNASDIHLEVTSQKFLQIRFRLDGVLQRVVTLPETYSSSLTQVVKQKASIDSFEKRTANEGQFSIQLGHKKIYCRVNVVPTINAEKITLRVISQKLEIIRLERLGLSLHDLQRIRYLLNLPNAVILLSGPAGSGKTTTLYSILSELNHYTKNITSIESPVEAYLEGVNQIPLLKNPDLDFTTLTRALFHHDVDILSLGEIRTKQDADLLVEAGLSGMTAFATIQASDAIKTIFRLKNLGVDIEQLALILKGIVSQRFVRKICPYCASEYLPEQEILEQAGLKHLPKDFKLRRGLGCKNCMGTGYLGRIPVFEVLILNETISSLIYQNKPHREIAAAATSEGFTSLRYDGLRKALAGITTLNEVLRVT